MADLRETFNLVTRDIEPDPDAWGDQERRQRRVVKNRRIGASGVAAGILAAATFLTITVGRNPGMTDIGGAPSMGPGSRSQPYFLDLRTGETTPLPPSLVPEDVREHTYVNYSVSSDGTELVYNVCSSFGCSGSDVMRVGAIDGTGARTLPVPEGLNGYLPRWNPDGTMLVYQLRHGGAGDVGNLFLHDASSERRTQLTDLELSRAGWWFLAARFSPDGQSVIFHQARVADDLRWDVWTVPVGGGEPTILVRDATYPAYFPDGTTLVIVNPAASDPRGQSLQIVDVDGSRRTLVEANSLLGISWPEVSPDGARIAYQDGGSIYVVDRDSGESSKVAVGDNAVWRDDHTLIISPVLRPEWMDETRLLR